MAAVSLTLHNLRPWAESYELTAECICSQFPGVEMSTPRAVSKRDGGGLAWEKKTHPPTITIPAHGKVSGLPLAAKDAPAVVAAVRAGALRISEHGSAAPASKMDAGANS